MKTTLNTKLVIVVMCATALLNAVITPRYLDSKPNTFNNYLLGTVMIATMPQLFVPVSIFYIVRGVINDNRENH